MSPTALKAVQPKGGRLDFDANNQDLLIFDVAWLHDSMVTELEACHH